MLTRPQLLPRNITKSVHEYSQVRLEMRLYNVLGEAEEPQKPLVIACLRQAQNRLILAWRLGHTRIINQGSRSHEHPYETGTGPCVF